jgi:hypothetical protein
MPGGALVPTIFRFCNGLRKTKFQKDLETRFMLMLQSSSKKLGDASWIYKSGSREVENYEINLLAINWTAPGKRSRVDE